MGVVRRAIFIVLILIAVLLIVPSGSPLSIGVVTSESMEPTINENDGYIAVSSNNIEPGDIVLFWSAKQGEYVTHRVVEETPQGYITKGDNNTATDQAAGFPPIPKSAIVAEVVTIGGNPLVIPNLGAIAPFIQANQPFILGAILLFLAFTIVRARRRGSVQTRRSVLRMKDILLPLFLVAFVTTLAITPLGANTFNLTYFATDQTVESGYAVTVGEPAVRTVTVDTTNPPFTRHVITGDGLTVLNRTQNGSALDITIRIPPTDTVGPYRASLTLYPYPAVLSENILDQLHRFHPIIAVLATSLLIYGPLFLLYLLAIDGDRPITAGRGGLLGRSQK